MTVSSAGPVLSPMSLLSQKAIPTRDRLIVALDLETVAQAKELVEQLGDSVSFYKIGLGLIFDQEYWPFFDWLVDRGKKAFADIKVYDVPETVRMSVRKLIGSRASFATVHAHEQMIKAAVDVRGDSELKILAVTVLTSLDAGDLREQGFPEPNVEDLVLSRAKRMLQLGCDGVISSGLEVHRLRQEFGNNFLIVVPGIRPIKNVDDQKRTIDVEDAFNRGADYIVVGRPIRAAEEPRQAAFEIQTRIAALFDHRNG